MIALPATGELRPKVAAWVADKCGITIKDDLYQAIMVVDDQQNFVAGVLVTNFRGTDCEISCASDARTAWRDHVCKAVFKYVFDQLGCIRCTSVTTKRNKRARAFLKALGFTLEGNLRLGYDGQQDALIYGLLRSECRYLAGDSEDV